MSAGGVHAGGSRFVHQTNQDLLSVHQCVISAVQWCGVVLRVVK